MKTNVKKSMTHGSPWWLARTSVGWKPHKVLLGSVLPLSCLLRGWRGWRGTFQNFSYWVCFPPLPALFRVSVGSWAQSTPPGSMGRLPLMWAWSGKESLEEDSLTDLGSHFYGNEVARAECLTLFGAVVAANYRQLCVPLLFARKVSIYLLARFIYFFLLLDCSLSPLLSLHPLEKKFFLLYLGDVCFPGCYGDEKPYYRGSSGEGRMGSRTQGSPWPCGTWLRSRRRRCGPLRKHRTWRGEQTSESLREASMEWSPAAGPGADSWEDPQDGQEPLSLPLACLHWTFWLAAYPASFLKSDL